MACGTDVVVLVEISLLKMRYNNTHYKIHAGLVEEEREQAQIRE